MSAASSDSTAPDRAPLELASPLPAPIPRPCLSIKTLLSPAPSGSATPESSSPITHTLATYNEADGKWFTNFAGLHYHTGNFENLNQPFIPTYEQQRLLKDSLDADLHPWKSPEHLESIPVDDEWHMANKQAMEKQSPEQSNTVRDPQPLVKGMPEAHPYQGLGQDVSIKLQCDEYGQLLAPDDRNPLVDGYPVHYQEHLPGYSPYAHPESAPGFPASQQWNGSHAQPYMQDAFPPFLGGQATRELSYAPPKPTDYHLALQEAHEYARWAAQQRHQRDTVIAKHHLHPPLPVPQASQAENNAQDPATPGGWFTNLPKELTQMIVERLNIAGYTRFARCSSFFKKIISENPWTQRIQFIMIANKAPFLSVVKTGILDYFNMVALKTFFDWQCIRCGVITNLIFIPRLCRICPHCLIHDPYCDIMIRTTAQVVYQLTDRVFKSIPRANLPITSSGGRHHLVVAREYALVVGLRRHGSEEKMRQAVLEADQKKQERYDKQYEAWKLKYPEVEGSCGEDSAAKSESHEADPKGRINPKKGRSLARAYTVRPPRAPKLSTQYALSMGHEVKEAAAVTVMFIDAQTGNFVPGFGCKECRDQNTIDTPRDYSRHLLTVYTEAKLEEHCRIAHPSLKKGGGKPVGHE